jgi:hypothetical protein
MNDDFDGADIVVAEDFLPVVSAVGGFENAALGIRRVEMTDRRDEKDVRVARIDGNLSDVLRVRETNARPRFSCVGRFVHPVSEAD